MNEASGVVAEYSTEAEALVAMAQLVGEGIRATVMGLGGKGVPVAPFRLVVAAKEVARAQQLLEMQREAELDEDWEDAAEQAIDGWMCEFCDNVASPAQVFCPVCGASRTEVRADDEEGID